MATFKKIKFGDGLAVTDEGAGVITVAGGGGPAGPTGPTGPTGPAGTAGTPGEKWFTGSGAPAGATGIVGDWYLDSATGDYYEKTGASAWTLRGNLKGPAGAGAVDATTTVKGIVQLAGDLAGTAASPQIAAGVITDADVAAANKDGAAATPSLRTLGTGAQQAAAGNDPRLIFRGARVYHNAAIPVSSGAVGTLPFNSERFDSEAIHDPTTNTTRLTCRTAGKYLITGCLDWQTNATGERQAILTVNGATTIAAQSTNGISGNTTKNVVTTVYDLAVNDYVELQVFQTSGVTLNVNAAPNMSPEFSIVWLGT